MVGCILTSVDATPLAILVSRLSGSPLCVRFSGCVQRRGQPDFRVPTPGAIDSASADVGTGRNPCRRDPVRSPSKVTLTAAAGRSSRLERSRQPGRFAIKLLQLAIAMIHIGAGRQTSHRTAALDGAHNGTGEASRRLDSGTPAFRPERGWLLLLWSRRQRNRWNSCCREVDATGGRIPAFARILIEHRTVPQVRPQPGLEPVSFVWLPAAVVASGLIAAIGSTRAGIQSRIGVRQISSADAGNEALAAHRLMSADGGRGFFVRIGTNSRLFGVCTIIGIHHTMKGRADDDHYIQNNPHNPPHAQFRSES